jgi:hypothetical protein
MYVCLHAGKFGTTRAAIIQHFQKPHGLMAVPRLCSPFALYPAVSELVLVKNTVAQMMASSCC